MLLQKWENCMVLPRYPKSFLTDSGGFQAFSLSDNVKIDEGGITFASHLDGSKHYFTPKKVIDIQHNLGI